MPKKKIRRRISNVLQLPNFKKALIDSAKKRASSKKPSLSAPPSMRRKFTLESPPSLGVLPKRKNIIRKKGKKIQRLK